MLYMLNHVYLHIYTTLRVITNLLETEDFLNWCVDQKMYSLIRNSKFNQLHGLFDSLQHARDLTGIESDQLKKIPTIDMINLSTIAILSLICRNSGFFKMSYMFSKITGLSKVSSTFFASVQWRLRNEDEAATLRNVFCQTIKYII